MEIRDVVHGAIEVNSRETQVIDSPFFQRLKNIKQLGFAENSYPGATHNRYIHSLGATHLAGMVFNQVFHGSKHPLASKPQTIKKFRQALRAAVMLHDIGHGPLSHTTEFAMPLVERLRLETLACVPEKHCPWTEKRQADHEDYTIKIVLQSSLTPILEKAYGDLGITPLHIACLINDNIVCPDSFFVEDGVDYRPILHQLVSSEIDVDRMDYLTRDSFYSGVSYGKFDLEWLISNLTHHIANNRCYLTLKHRAIYTFDDFLLSRFNMFLMVYFHHKSVIFDEMLARYLKSADCDYEIPSNVEEYIFFDDYHLYTHLSRSKNPWAKRIYHKNPYHVFAEFHSGIPQGAKHLAEQKLKLNEIVTDLKEKKIDHIVKTTTGELSKYFRKLGGGESHSPIYVRYDDKYSPVQFIPLEECTDLFERYSEKRTITRVYTP